MTGLTAAGNLGVGATAYHATVTTTLGALYAFGDNSLGAYGNSNTTSSSLDQLPNDGRVAEIGSGDTTARSSVDDFHQAAQRRCDDQASLFEVTRPIEVALVAIVVVAVIVVFFRSRRSRRLQQA
jgi:hypothetical protein